MSDTETPRTTRWIYCPHCEGKGRPKESEPYLVYNPQKGSVLRKVIEKETERRGELGITPHFIRELAEGVTDIVEDNEVVVEATCCMNNCGVLIYKNTEGGWSYKILHKSILTMKRSDWNALLTKLQDLGLHQKV